MLQRIGTTFPTDWQYGPEEIEIFNKTAEQIDKKFPNSRNLLINTTWFGPQFDNIEWKKIQLLFDKKIKFDNLFLLSVIDPLYLKDEHLSEIQIRLAVKNTYKIGMFDGSAYEWNFHAIVGDHLMPKYKDTDVTLTTYEKDFLCYQRKPRAWRVDFAQLLKQNDLLKNGVVTLGGKNENEHDWSEGRTWEPIVLEDDPKNYKHNGAQTDYAGVPNDLVTLGRLDIWNKCFLYISSETVFNHWEPIFVNERIWKTMIGLRPFIIQGNPKTYAWLRKNGFKTFNQYWSHIDLENSTNILQDHIAVLKFLATLSPTDKMAMYKDMYKDLLYNKKRFYEFSKEQRNKMEHIFT